MSKKEKRQITTSIFEASTSDPTSTMHEANPLSPIHESKKSKTPKMNFTPTKSKIEGEEFSEFKLNDNNIFESKSDESTESEFEILERSQSLSNIFFKSIIKTIVDIESNPALITLNDSIIQLNKVMIPSTKFPEKEDATNLMNIVNVITQNFITIFTEQHIKSPEFRGKFLSQEGEEKTTLVQTFLKGKS